MVYVLLTFTGGITFTSVFALIIGAETGVVLFLQERLLCHLAYRIEHFILDVSWVYTFSHLKRIFYNIIIL